jgi:hypothetical protein
MEGAADGRPVVVSRWYSDAELDDLTRALPRHSAPVCGTFGSAEVDSDGCPRPRPAACSCAALLSRPAPRPLESLAAALAARVQFFPENFQFWKRLWTAETRSGADQDQEKDQDQDFSPPTPCVQFVQFCAFTHDFHDLVFKKCSFLFNNVHSCSLLFIFVQFQSV